MIRKGLVGILRQGVLIIGVWLAALVVPVSNALGCTNEAVRIQQGSAALPECRAYELVTPSDSNGRFVEGLSSMKLQSSGSLFPTELITPSGEGMAFMTFDGPLGELGKLTGTLDVSGAQRLSGGWEITRRFSPGGEQAVAPIPGGISEDHLFGFTEVLPVKGSLPGGELGSAGNAQYLANPDGSFELVGVGSVGGTTQTERLSQGRYISAGGGHVIFSTGRSESGSYHCFEIAKGNPSSCPVHRLAENAPPEGIGTVYDRAADGPTRVVSLLPGDQTPGKEAAYQGVSRSGATVAFKIEEALYVRVPDGEDGHTVKVTEGTTAFAGISNDGRYLFYVAGGESGTIHRYDTETGDDVAVNPTAAGEVVNVSADGSHVYFIAEEEIAGDGSPGAPNLFVWSGGTSPRYIGTVAPSDLVKTSNDGPEEEFGLNLPSIPALTNWTDWAVKPDLNKEEGPGADSSRTSPDGKVIVFESRASLTGYENAGHTEIYRYADEGEGNLVCVSCNLLADSAKSDARLQLLTLVPPPNVIHNVSSDGKHVFFETTEALVSEDSDGVNDIYEWNEESSGPSLKLISSGRSIEVPAIVPEPLFLPKPNVIFGITPSASDVVFLSQDELVEGAGSGGTPNLYDARVGGGFLAPPSPSICVEEGCHSSLASTPSLESPRSTSTGRSANFKRRKKHRCHRAAGKHRKHRTCSKHKSKKSGSGASNSAATRGSAVAAVSPPSKSSRVAASYSSFAAANHDADASSSAAFAAGEFAEFGINSVAAEETTAVAGMHPNLLTRITLNHFTEAGRPAAHARTEDVQVRLPSGLLGNPNATAKCSTQEFTAFANCPLASQVGIAKVLAVGLNGEFAEPVYSLVPPHPDQEIARFGFYAGTFPVYIDVNVRAANDYGVTATVHHGPGQTSLVTAETTLWGNPSDESHDKQRLLASEAFICDETACEAENGERAVPRTGLAFMTNPSACQEGSVDFAVTSYQLPGQIFEASAPLEPITDCAGLPFAPSFSAEPTSHTAGAPTGLKTKLVLPQHLRADERATATMRAARVTLPTGMQIAAGAANWIGTCSEAQVGLHEEVDAACPDASKLGTATIVSPALSRPLQGTLYQRPPSPGHQFGLWLVSDDLGLHVKIPGELQPDPNTGRLTAVFTDLPQVPVEEIDFDIWGGDRAPLQNPDHCGTYATDYSFFPHSEDPTVSGQSQLTIDQGCNQGFDPKLEAGVTNPKAGKYSPLIIDLTKGDGQQNLRGFEVELPDGELAKLKGVPLCSDAAATTGACPADTAIGHLAAAAGPGSEPLWVPQPGKSTPQVYLAGPYEGNPFSVVAVVPAQAGAFDLGNVVVRSGLGLDPDTNRAVVKADPLPQFFEGVGLTYRRLHAVVDRPGFSLNPTDCSAMKVDSTVTSTQGAVAHPSSPFQVHGCKRLGFKPKLTLKLKGGTKRGQYPQLTALLKARKGDANIGKVSVALPHSEFLAQEHIATICTRKQFAADKCPKGSVYGTAKAWTPLLAKPLEGPVYLRSSNHLLPDLVAALGGELEVNLDGRIDSRNGGIRTTFETVPDAPVTKFVLGMRGGAKSLLVNSTDICLGRHRAQVAMRGQNGRESGFGAPLRSGGCRSRHG